MSLVAVAAGKGRRLCCFRVWDSVRTSAMVIEAGKLWFVGMLSMLDGKEGDFRDHVV